MSNKKQINSINDLVYVPNQDSTQVEYRLYKGKTKAKTAPTLKTKFSTHNGACFSQLRYNVGSHTRINYKPTHQNISEEKAIEWIDFCVEKGLLPDHVSGKKVMSKGVVLDLQQPRSLTYVHLCLVRYIAEEVALINATRFLAQEKVNIFAALILAGKTLCNNHNHNFISGASYYGAGPKISGVKIPVSTVIGLRRFWLNPEKYDQQQSYFVAIDIINRATKNAAGFDLSLNWSEYKNPYIIEAIEAENDEEAEKALKNYQRYIK